MIFITVGTEKFGFDRLLQAVDIARGNKQISQEIFAQTGSSDYKPKFFSSKDYLPFTEIVKLIQDSDITICHAGVGSTLLCLSLGKIPILFPRRVLLGEHLDDHQLNFAKEMDLSGKALVAYNTEELLEIIQNYGKKIDQMISSSGHSTKYKLIRYLQELCEKEDEG